MSDNPETFDEKTKRLRLLLSDYAPIMRPMKDYRPRVADAILEKRLNIMGAVLIEGPKWCGKTTTAKELAKSYVVFQDPDWKSVFQEIAEDRPSLLLEGANPRLFDEWQDAPNVWLAVRKSCDERREKGLYILTGSTSVPVDVPHTGVGRIDMMRMRPMSLYESGESTGAISLRYLFDGADIPGMVDSGREFEEVVHAICRGGWPESLSYPPKDATSIASALFREISASDVSKAAKRKTNPNWVKAVIKAYARNVCTPADFDTLYRDATSSSISAMSKPTFRRIVDVLERLFLIEDIEAWSPNIRSKSAIRSRKKRNLVDPSLAVAALDLSPSYFLSPDTLAQGYRYLGFLFESLCMRDLSVYADAMGGTLSYYRDKNGLECDAVIHLPDGRYGLVECKMGQSGFDEAAKHLLTLESAIKEARDDGRISFGDPSFKMILTANRFGYARKDGVSVVPITALKD